MKKVFIFMCVAVLVIQVVARATTHYDSGYHYIDYALNENAFLYN